MRRWVYYGSAVAMGLAAVVVGQQARPARPPGRPAGVTNRAVETEKMLKEMGLDTTAVEETMLQQQAYRQHLEALVKQPGPVAGDLCTGLSVVWDAGVNDFRLYRVWASGRVERYRDHIWADIEIRP